jgi:hypothetical protein
VPGWIRLGRTHSAIDLRVGCEPGGAGALRGSPKPVITQSCGHGRLSSRTFWGARRRQGPGSSPGRSHRLDLDGWLVRAKPDTITSEGPAASGRPLGESYNLNRFAPNTSLGPGPLCAIDTCLLMGGTFMSFHHSIGRFRMELEAVIRCTHRPFTRVRGRASGCRSSAACKRQR